MTSPSKGVRRKPKAEIATPALEVALTGKGIRPKDVTIRHLAEMLTATASAIDAVARERGITPVQPSLRRIRSGSAVMVLEADAEDDTWPEVVTQFYDAAATRAAGYGSAVRSAFGKLFRTAKIGALSITATGLGDAKRAESIVMALPLEVVPSVGVFTTTVYGRVVGVNAYDARNVVWLASVDGGREDFDVDTAGAERAAKFYNRMVRVTMVAGWDGEKASALGIEDMQLWNETDFLAALTEVREELTREGVHVDAEAWMKELDS